MEETDVVEPQEIDEPTAAEPAEPAEGAEPAPADPEETADPAAEPEPPKKNRVQERIDEITRARRQAEQEAEYWRKVATGEIPPSQQQQAQQQGEFLPPGLPPKPQLDQFEDYDAYAVALGEWGAEKAILTRDYRAAQGKVQAEKQAVASSHAARMEAAKAKYEDLDEVFALAPEVAFNDDTFSAIIESDQSADIAYHLAKNPKEAVRLNSLSPVQQIKEIARLEDRFKAATTPVKRVSQAPIPVNPVGGSGDPATKDPDKMSDDEWLAHERQRLAKLGRRY